MKKLFIILLSIILLQGCASTFMAEALERGKMTFVSGNYKLAFRQLLPLAVKGNGDAQYAVGYMYFYGYGVPQDPESGIFWMKQSANQGYIPAINALNRIQYVTTQSTLH